MEQEVGTARRDEGDVEEELLLLQLHEPKALNRQCLRCIEDHFDAIPDLRQLPGVVAQQVLEYMMKRRKGGSRTLNDSNVRKFLLHEVPSPPQPFHHLPFVCKRFNFRHRYYVGPTIH